MVGGASAPPTPLKNPVDALVKTLFKNGNLLLKTRDALYKLTVYEDSFVQLQYTKTGLITPRYREWHLAGNSDNTTKACALIAAILSEDSYETQTDSSLRGRKLWSMVCGTTIMSHRSRLRVRKPPTGEAV